MLKSQLIAELGKRCQLPEKDIVLGVKLIIELMTQALSTNNRIEIRGFGSFSLRYIPPHRAHNPKTGEKVITTSKYRAHFKPGKELREALNTAVHKGTLIVQEDKHK